MDGLAAKAVQPGNFFGPDLRAYGFQYQGYPLGGWVAENILESGFAYFAHAQGVVAIDRLPSPVLLSLRCMPLRY